MDRIKRPDHKLRLADDVLARHGAEHPRINAIAAVIAHDEVLAGTELERRQDDRVLRATLWVEVRLRDLDIIYDDGRVGNGDRVTRDRDDALDVLLLRAV